MKTTAVMTKKMISISQSRRQSSICRQSWSICRGIEYQKRKS